MTTYLGKYEFSTPRNKKIKLNCQELLQALLKFYKCVVNDFFMSIRKRMCLGVRI